MRRWRWHEILDRLPDGPCSLAEIGVWEGKLSRHLLEARGDLMLVLVDPWEAEGPGEPWYDSASTMAEATAEEMAQVKQRAMSAIAAANGRVRVIERRSIEAAPLVDPASLDMVFIDAVHTYPEVAADIEAWLPKVKPGGWIAGHDFGNVRFMGVRKAVTERFGNDIETGHDHTWFHRVAG